MANLPNPADLKYSGYYLPVFSLLYIYQEIGLPVEFSWWVIQISLTEENFGHFMVITLFGALIGHAMSRSIFGIEGAKQNPKNQRTLLWYRITLILKKAPGKPPRDLEQFRNKLARSANKFEEKSSIDKILTGAYVVIRAIVIWTSKFGFLVVAYFTTWILALQALSGQLKPIGGLLLVAQLIFFLGSFVFARFATSVPVDSAPWIYVSEYEKARILHDRGDIDFEYGPIDFSDDIQELSNSLVDEDRQDGPDWLIPLDHSETDEK